MIVMLKRKKGKKKREKRKQNKTTKNKQTGLIEICIQLQLEEKKTFICTDRHSCMSQFIQFCLWGDYRQL